MGKATKSISQALDKKSKADLKLQKLQKVKKANNAIRKEKTADSKGQKNDIEELKNLLKIEGAKDVIQMTDVDMEKTQKKKKPSIKQRKFK